MPREVQTWRQAQALPAAGGELWLIPLVRLLWAAVEQAMACTLDEERVVERAFQYRRECEGFKPFDLALSGPQERQAAYVFGAMIARLGLRERRAANKEHRVAGSGAAKLPLTAQAPSAPAPAAPAIAASSSTASSSAARASPAPSAAAALPAAPAAAVAARRTGVRPAAVLPAPAPAADAPLSMTERRAVVASLLAFRTHDVTCVEAPWFKDVEPELGALPRAYARSNNGGLVYTLAELGPMVAVPVWHCTLRNVGEAGIGRLQQCALEMAAAEVFGLLTREGAWEWMAKAVMKAAQLNGSPITWIMRSSAPELAQRWAMATAALRAMGPNTVEWQQATFAVFRSLAMSLMHAYAANILNANGLGAGVKGAPPIRAELDDDPEEANA
jgi:hypothetical protein